MTFEIDHCTASGDTGGAVETGGQLDVTLVPDSNFYFGESPTGDFGVKLNCTVKMGGADITSSAMTVKPNGSADISISTVTGSVVIKVTAETHANSSSGSNAPSAGTHNVTLNLSHCTASNTSGTTGGTYANTLTPDEGYIFVRSGPSLGGVNYGGSGSEGGDGSSEASIALECRVIMDDENVTAASFDIATGEIEIEEVTGDIIITVEPSQA